MASFKEFRQILLLYYGVDRITDEDFIILYEFFSSRNPDFAYDLYDRFHLDNMNDDDFKAEFRVRKTSKGICQHWLKLLFKCGRCNMFVFSFADKIFHSTFMFF